MMRFVMALVLLVGGCATTAHRPSRPAPVTTTGPIAPPPMFGIVLPPPAAEDEPEASCEDLKPCVPHLTLDGRVDEGSVGKLIKGIDAWNKAGAKSILLEINSGGGSVFDGLDLAKKIEDSKAPVNCVVDGEAASMAFYLLQSCATRTMTRRSILMAHQPSVGAGLDGPEENWRNIAEVLRALSKAMAAHCSYRLAVTLEEYEARTSGSTQWWFSFEDAKRFHAVDTVYPTRRDAIADLSR